jgi:hypothetical protein
MSENNKVGLKTQIGKKVATRTGLLVIIVNLLLIFVGYGLIDNHYKNQVRENAPGIDQILANNSLKPLDRESQIYKIEDYETTITLSKILNSTPIEPIKDNLINGVAIGESGQYLLYTYPLNYNKDIDNPVITDITLFLKSVLKDKDIVSIKNNSVYLQIFDSSNQVTILKLSSPNILQIRNYGSYTNNEESISLDENQLTLNIINTNNSNDKLTLEVDLQLLTIPSNISQSIKVTKT